jgi:hypothetical protein
MHTGALRCLPDFLIIGAQRSGTSSLYNYLIQNAAVLPALKKEVHYFDDGYAHGLSWYRAHFATRLHRTLVEQRLGAARIFEASPYYILHPHAARRIRQVLPDVRLIAVLRNPVDRAESHYHHEVRRGRETLPFEEALEREPERLAGELERLTADETYASFNHRRYSYLARGRYAEQISVWRSTFPADRLLVLRSEDLFADPAAVVGRTLDWLGVSGPTHGAFKTFNQANYTHMPADTRRRLIDYFAPHNQRLYELLGRDMQWDR